MNHAPKHPDLAVWPALLLAPLLALGQLSLAYARVTPACARKDGVGLHGLSALALLLAMTMTVLAWRTWARLARRPGSASPVTDSDATHAASRQRLLALLSTLVGALASLVIAAMWLPLILLPPCS